MQIKDAKQIYQRRLHRPQIPTQMKKQNRPSDQQASQRRSWWRSAFVGYALSFVFIAGTFLVSRIEAIEHIHDYFIGVPFLIGTLLVGWIWGTGPALVALVVGVLCLDYWLIPPGRGFTFYQWPDTVAFIPFIVIQLIILYIIALQKKYRQQLLLAQQEASEHAEELAKSNQALAQSNLQLEQADRVKDQFLSMASHELRTPITSIHGYLQLLIRRLKKQSAQIPEMLLVQDSLVKVDQQTKRLTILVNDLLDINSLRSGKMPLRLAPCDLSQLCCEIVTDQKALTSRVIDLQLPPDPIVLHIDETRLSQVMNNLVTNAIKYSPAHAVVQVEVSQRSEEAILAVHNDGSVLSQEQQTTIFEPFYRSPEAQSSDAPGWGLGLPISKEIVEQHQGRLWVESSEETGTTFFVALNLEISKI
ncbi:MAG: HAMP domain-containing sensor histidine kinase [Ktedonobacteraceae bacterium]